MMAADQQYRIGGYSQYPLGAVDKPREVFGALADKLSKAGFNLVLYSMGNNEISNGRLEQALAGLNEHHVASVIDDWAWIQDGPVGVAAMAHSNYMKMEAEYDLSKPGQKFNPDILGPNDISSDKYNYAFKHDTGQRSETDSSRWSNSYAWICDADAGNQAGIALSEPRFRWKPGNQEYSRAIGSDLKFFIYTNENRLYLRVAMQWTGIAEGDKVADISLKALNVAAMTAAREFGVYAPEAYIDMNLRSTSPGLYGTTILNYPYQGVPRDQDTGALLFEYYIDIPQAKTELYQKVMSGDHFVHISPTLYWHGKGRLELDYIELEDETYRALTIPGHPLRKRLQDRLDQIAAVPKSETILYLYGKDEPYQGQFAGYARLKEFLQAMGKNLLTATHLENPNLQKPQGAAEYFHFGLFLDEAKPSVVMLDAYALIEWGVGNSTLIRWNADLEHELFIQNKIQRVVLNNYRKLATSVRRDPDMKGTQMFFVPQTFGEKYEPVETAEWRYFMPPRSMQKCLQFLPLCYSADGIVDFCVTANPGQSFPSLERKYRRCTPLVHDANFRDLSIPEGSVAYQQLTEANQKILVYGPIIQDLNWVDADSVMVNGMHPNIPLRDLDLKSLQVLPSQNGPYAGYVQCGYYTNAKGDPTFMLVNRRAVYKNQDAPPIVPWDVDNYFTDAKPQTLRFVLDDKAGTSLPRALFDPYAQKLYPFVKGSVDIMIDAGDGILLQMVSLLPETVKKADQPSEATIVNGPVTVNKKRNVSFSAENPVIFREDTVITLKDKARMIIPSNAVFEPNVKFILHPKAILEWDTQVFPEFPAQIERLPKKRCWFKRLFGIK
jgi:hypothetical protein